MPLKGDPSSQYSLLGQDPEAALSVSFTAIQFYIQQQQVYATAERKVLEDKLQHTKHHAKQKLAEFQSAYKQAKAESAAEHKRRLDLQADQKELLEKYNQRATQNDRVIYTMKQEIEALKRSRGGSGPTIPLSSSSRHQHQHQHQHHHQQNYPINTNRFRSPSPAIAAALQHQPTIALRNPDNRPLLNNNTNAAAASPLNPLNLPASPTNGFFESKTPVSMFPAPPPPPQQQQQKPPMLHSGSSLPRPGSSSRGTIINDYQIIPGTGTGTGTGGLYGMFADVPGHNSSHHNNHRNHRTSPQPHAPTTSTSFRGSLGGSSGGGGYPLTTTQRQQQYGGRRGAVTPATSTGFSM